MAVNRMGPEPGGGGLISSVGERFSNQTTLVLIFAVLGAVAAILIWLLSQQGTVVEELARENAAAVARSVEAFHQMYGDEVEKRVAALRSNPGAAAVIAALPDRDEAVQAMSRYGGARVQVFRSPGGTEFQRAAAASLDADRGAGYAEVRHGRDGTRLLYAVDANADGVAVEVEMPVQPIAALAYPGLRFWLIALGTVVSIGLLGLLLRSWSSATGMQRYMQAQEAAKRELEREVAERTKIEEDLRAQAQEVIQGVGVVSEAVSRILTSMTQVVSGATETAASVTEAATTVEQVKQTSQLSNQRATDVATIAERAVQISQTGEHSVREAIEGMTLVRDQMQSIAESVRKLGDQSRAIGEIITAVSELAEQSNLLAINAAIEAAKAGEHGKGFAVVAQEVKALAEQSKQATAQVRTMLEQIQRAANVAVMVTEQGTKSAESGVKQSLEAGESIRALANSISEAAQAVGQISASSQQQLIGMDQVATAMQDIKEGSQENVASMREIESSVQNLSEVGASLEALVSRYVVPNKPGLAA
jgi:methyl-accepting chemotaxis protein